MVGLSFRPEGEISSLPMRNVEISPSGRNDKIWVTISWKTESLNSRNNMGKYDDRSYHQLRRMYRCIPDEDKSEVSLRISNYLRILVERGVNRQHPDWSEAERKAAVFERIYRDAFAPDEMERIKAAIVAFHQ